STTDAGCATRSRKTPSRSHPCSESPRLTAPFDPCHPVRPSGNQHRADPDGGCWEWPKSAPVGHTLLTIAERPGDRPADGGERIVGPGPVVVVLLTHRDPPLVQRLVDRVLAGRDVAVVIHHDPRGPELA